MNRRAFFCGLAVSPVAVLASLGRQIEHQEALTSIRIKVDSSDLRAFAEAVDRQVTQSLARRDAAAALRVQEIFDRRG